MSTITGSEDSSKIITLLPPFNALKSNLALAVLFLLSNPGGDGAMDKLAKAIAALVKESGVGSSAESEIIRLQSIISQMEKQLGMTKGGGNPNTPDMQKLMAEFKDAYNKLKVDVGNLTPYEKSNPDLKPVIEQINTFTSGLKSGNNFITELEAYKGGNIDGTFATTLKKIGSEYYDSNNDKTGTKGTSWLASNYTSSDNAKSMLNGTNQQFSTKINGKMQVSNSLNQVGQQINSGFSTLMRAIAQGFRSN